MHIKKENITRSEVKTFLSKYKFTTVVIDKESFASNEIALMVMDRRLLDVDNFDFVCGDYFAEIKRN